MNAVYRGLIFAALQIAMVSSLGAKLLWDRAHQPRGWAQTRGYDPQALIRGRYITMSLLVNADNVYSEEARRRGLPLGIGYGYQNVFLTVENGKVMANATSENTGLTVGMPEWGDNGEKLARLTPPVVFFLPEHAADPMQQRWAGKLLLEVTIPKKGPPRPIRFGRDVNGKFTILDVN
jgi:hypothetical protein